MGKCWYSNSGTIINFFSVSSARKRVMLSLMLNVLRVGLLMVKENVILFHLKQYLIKQQLIGVHFWPINQNFLGPKVMNRQTLFLVMLCFLVFFKYKITWFIRNVKKSNLVDFLKGFND